MKINNKINKKYIVDFHHVDLVFVFTSNYILLLRTATCSQPKLFLGDNGGMALTAAVKETKNQFHIPTRRGRSTRNLDVCSERKFYIKTSGVFPAH